MGGGGLLKRKMDQDLGSGRERVSWWGVGSGSPSERTT